VAAADAAGDPLLAATLNAEAALLALHPAGTPHTRRAIPIAGASPAAHLHVISVGDPSAPPLLLLHGWGAGAGVFAPALPALAAHFRVHAVDWLGCGSSSRPPHPALAPRAIVAPTALPPAGPTAAAEGAGAAAAAVAANGGVHAAAAAAAAAAHPERGGPGVAWFLDALDGALPTLRAAEGGWAATGGRFHVVGHSLGGYLAGMYALGAWPGGDASEVCRRVASLTLASPVGLPPAPPRIHPPADAPLAKRALFGVVFGLWGSGWTPQVVLRMLPEGPGRRLVARMVYGRVREGGRGGQLTSASGAAAADAGTAGADGAGGGDAGGGRVPALVEYVYRLSVREGSGEAALTSVLGVGAWARVPLGRLLVRRVTAVGAVGAEEGAANTAAAAAATTAKAAAANGGWEGRGVTFVYGARDWMDRTAGEAVVKSTRRGSVVIVEDAGHHLYWDNVDGFVQAVLQGTGMAAAGGGR